MKPCTYDGCDRPHDSNGYCAGHNRQIRQGKPLTPLRPYDMNKGRDCSGPKCDRPAYTHGLCRTHTAQQSRGQELTVIGEVRSGPKTKYTDRACRFEGCDRIRCRRGLCHAHWQQEKNGEALTPLPPLLRGVRRPCAGPDCDQPAKTRGLCGGHYSQWQRGHELTPLGTTIRGQQAKYDGVHCSGPRCDRQARAHGLCRTHYAQQRAGKALYPIGEPPPKPVVLCSVKDCPRSARRRGMCMLHYDRVMRTGSPDRTHKRSGERYVEDTGYVLVRRPGHPEAKKGSYAYEHRAVMSDMLGRPLIKGEQVHHRNGDRTDNQPGNLELWSTSQPKGQRVIDKLRWWREWATQYDGIPDEVLEQL